ncbi:neutral alpha-glucosidase AB [Cimex lectularius]|uniref:Glucosidase II subunit alpha n=1 Tax=Cimex lectularius TaxID=79782 RepID=A0A8I6RXP7_CIMLE|nr:neutral alpha-glucosidase AB [Cimex lectularius]
MVVRNRRYVLCLAFLAIQQVWTVDRSNFKSCEQSSFCRRCRNVEKGKSPYELDLSTLSITNSGLQVQLINTENLVKFILKVTPLEDSTLRIQVEEETPLRQRFVPPLVLDGDPVLSSWEVKSKSDRSVTLSFNSYEIVLQAVPFKIDVFKGSTEIASVNARGLFKFEHTRPKPQEKDESEDAGAWEENFKSHHDSKPFGPTAVAMDVTFKGAKFAYGIPEHSDSLALKSTSKGDPYRLYNLDVFEYEINSVMSLYAAIPFLIAHSEDHTVGFFWLNPSETWIDVETHNDVVSSIVNFVGAKQPQVETHFMSESGNIDAFLTLGPKPKDVFRQYSALTGTAPIPPYFSLGYHQSRWNYNDQEDVDAVNKGFDEHDLPMDALWLDIEHTDSKKYFTWDQFKFSNPVEMQQNLTARGRKLVVIIDPHIKRDESYFLHNDATSNGYYVKNQDGTDYEGWCWPGSSSYLDFLNPQVREYYASRYNLQNYVGSTENLHIWNDMNEPSVFNGPEVTMPKDKVHHGGWEHREIHNVYSLLHVSTGYEGMLRRSAILNIEETQRPFMLTRSAFAGSQRFSAIWTGDNAAEWAHLRASLPMCLSLAVAGMSFCGADVGGFFQNPDRELFARWYQAATFLPFFRAHSHIETKRREPWSFDEEVTSIIRDALRTRYNFLPLWYTLFHENNKTGMPVIRPLWVEYPEDAQTFDIDDEFLVGHSLLVKPAFSPGTSQVQVYFPGENTVWYDIDNHEQFTSGTANVPAPFTKVPVYYRGGAIIPKKMRVRRSSQLMHNDPFTIIVALDNNKKASGHLYLDDGTSHRHHFRKDSSVLIKYEYSDNKLSSMYVGENRYNTPCWVERIIILGLPLNTYKVTAYYDKKEIHLETVVDYGKRGLVIRKPKLPVAKEWHLKLH